MKPAPTKSQLSPARRQLVELMQRVRFGRIHRLVVYGGEPVLGGVVWTRTVKLTGANESHPAARPADFALPKESAAFFNQLSLLGDAEILEFLVRDGLPVEFQLSESLAG